MSPPSLSVTRASAHGDIEPKETMFHMESNRVPALLLHWFAVNDDSIITCEIRA
jgi:hypothetical protein